MEHFNNVLMDQYNVWMINVYLILNVSMTVTVPFLSGKNASLESVLVHVPANLIVEDFKDASKEVVFLKINVQDFLDAYHSKIAVKDYVESSAEEIVNVAMK